METTLKSAQLSAIYRMLAFNEDEDRTASAVDAASRIPQWKILIYDGACRSIISPILSVQQLRRQCGVTLHLLLHSDREAIPDVPAVYFVQPTRENLARIAQDAAKALYSAMHLNFVTKLDRSLMEEFAQLVVQTNSLSQIAAIHDQYLDFTCYESALFTLNKTNSYVIYNGTQSTEAVIDQFMTHIAYSLFSVVATLGQIPILRCPKGGAPEMVARKLNRMIVEHPTLLHSKGSHVVSGGSRPLLVLFDRNADLITPIQHCSTYQALIDDVLQHKANRVEFAATTESTNAKNKGGPLMKKYDLDPETDPFYSNYKFIPFPDAIEQNDAELRDVTQREQAIRSSATTTTTTAPDPAVGVGAADLASAVDSLPALIERKKQLEVHTSILQGVMNQVAARDVPQFYDVESSLATGSYRNDLPKAKKDVLALVEAKGNVYDKTRLILVYAMATGAKTADIDEVTAALQQACAAENKEALESGMQAIQYIKHLRSMHMIPSANDMLQELQSSSNKTNESSTMFSSLMAKATTQATGFLAKASDRVSSLLGKIHKHHTTVVIEHLCDMRDEDETFLYLDPKVKGDVDLAQRQAIARPPVRDVIAFVIGGGCYSEYQNLQMIAQDDRRTITYGCTELLDPDSFVQQLGQLGK